MFPLWSFTFHFGKKMLGQPLFFNPWFYCWTVGIKMEKKQKQLALNFMVPGVKIANFGASRFTQAFAKV